MASVDIQKMTTGMMVGRNRHYGKDERVTMQHSNTDIDKGLSHLNYDYGTKDYAEAIQQYKEQIEQIDALYPPKRVTRDRVTGYSLVIPCPKEIERAGKSDLFFDKTWEFLERWMPEGSLIHGQVHKDEVHEYYDSRKQARVESCEHMHVEGVAYAEWKDKKGNERKGINGKNFFSRDKLYKKLNKDFAEMVWKEFDVEYNTKEGARRERTETLKAESRIAEAQEKAKESEAHMESLVEKETSLKANADYYQEMAEMAHEEMDKLHIVTNNLQQTITAQQDELKNLTDEKQALDAEIAQRRNDLSQMQGLLDEHEAKRKRMLEELEQLRVQAEALSASVQAGRTSYAQAYSQSRKLDSCVGALKEQIKERYNIADSIYTTQAEGISMYVGKGGLTDKQMGYLSKQFDAMLKDNDPEHDWMRECYNNQYGGYKFKQLWLSKVKRYCESHPAQHLHASMSGLGALERKAIKISAGVGNYLISGIKRSADEYERDR